MVYPGSFLGALVLRLALKSLSCQVMWMYAFIPSREKKRASLILNFNRALCIGRTITPRQYFRGFAFRMIDQRKQQDVQQFDSVKDV